MSFLFFEALLKEAYNSDTKVKTFTSVLKNTIDRDSGKPITKSEIMDEAITLLLAGHETIANSISWCLKFLAENPEKEEKSYLEVSKLSSSEKITYEQIRKEFSYCRAVFFESLRLCPIVPTIPRFCLDGFESKNLNIQHKGIAIIMSCVNNLGESLWDNPTEFKPERFLNLSSGEEEELEALRSIRWWQAQLHWESLC